MTLQRGAPVDIIEISLQEKVPMAGDKPNSKPRFGAKSDFVRSLDPSIPAAEVVAMAEKKGIKLTTGLVYNIRSSANAAGKSSGKGKLKAKGEYKPGSPEARLRAAIAEIGLAKARQILEEVEATFAGH
jgi:hypothetical protein